MGDASSDAAPSQFNRDTRRAVLAEEVGEVELGHHVTCGVQAHSRRHRLAYVVKLLKIGSAQLVR